MSDFISGLRKQIDAAGDNLKILRELAKSIYESLNIVDNNITQLQEQLVNLPDIAEKDALNTAYGDAEEIIMGKLQDALRINKEFNTPAFSSPLKEAIRNPGLVTIYPRGNSCRAYVEMERVAGNVEDYAKAVTKTREDLQIGKLPGPAAAKMWKEKFYGTAREGRRVPRRKYKKEYKGKKAGSDKTDTYKQQYWLTIRHRLANMDSLAPYWYILNYGNTSLSSDRGGEAYPVASETLFVEKSEIAIRKKYEDAFIKASDKYKRGFENAIKKAENNRRTYQDFIYEIEDRIYSIELQNAEKVRPVIDKIKARLERTGRLDKADRARIALLARLIAEKKADVSRRYRLSAQGEDKVIIRIRQIVAELEREGNI